MVAKEEERKDGVPMDSRDSVTRVVNMATVRNGANRAKGVEVER